MRKIAVAVSSFLLTMAVYAGYVGVMTDESTGIVAPPVLEARIAKWAAITGKPTTVDGYGITDAATESWVVQYVADNTTPSDMTNEPAFKGWTNIWHDLITNHLNITAGNPHGITPAMIGAATTDELASAVSGLVATDTFVAAIAGLVEAGDYSTAIGGLSSSIESISNSFFLLSSQSGQTVIGDVAFTGIAGGSGSEATISLKERFMKVNRVVSSIDGSHGVVTIYDNTNGFPISADRNFGLYVSNFNVRGVLKLSDSNSNLMFGVSTSGTASAKSFRRVTDTATNDVAVSVTLDGTTYAADSDGDIDLGSPIFTNAYDGIARELAFTAYKSATNADAVSATAYSAGTNAYYWAGLAYEAGTNASIIGTNAYNWATTAYAIAVASLASATDAFARTEILDAFIQTNVITKSGFILTTGTNDTSWDAASQTLNIRLADIGNALVGATITGGTITTNAGILDIVVDGGISAADATNIAQAVVAAATTNDMPLIDFGGGGASPAPGKSLGASAVGWPILNTNNAPFVSIIVDTNMVAMLNFPLDTANAVDSMPIVSDTSASITQLVFVARAYAAAGSEWGTVGLKTTFGGSILTNVITLTNAPTTQTVTLAHAPVSGPCVVPFSWGILATSTVGTAVGNVRVSVMQARGSW